MDLASQNGLDLAKKTPEKKSIAYFADGNYTKRLSVLVD